MPGDRELATVELVGVLTYAQLRGFEVTARAIRVAPDVRAADRVADFARSEHAGYVRLRDHLQARTDLADPVMDRQKPRVDAYFDEAPTGQDWLAACAFFAVALPLVADFVEAIAPSLDADTRAVVTEALTQRASFAAYAVGEVSAALQADPQIRERVRHLVADLTGRALTQFQGAIAETDALDVLLDGEAGAGDDRIRATAIGVLDGHRRRMAALGIDEPEEQPD